MIISLCSLSLFLLWSRFIPESVRMSSASLPSLTLQEGHNLLHWPETTQALEGGEGDGHFGLVVVIRVVLWSLEVQLLCQLLWVTSGGGQSETSFHQQDYGLCSPCCPPAPAARWQWLLTSDNKPSQGIMQKLGVSQPRVEKWAKQIQGRAGIDLRDPACGSESPNNRHELCDLGK